MRVMVRDRDRIVSIVSWKGEGLGLRVGGSGLVEPDQPPTPILTPIPTATPTPTPNHLEEGVHDGDDVGG